MPNLNTDIIIFDDHELRGSALQSLIEAAGMARICSYHDCNFEADPEPGSIPVRIVTTNGQRSLGIYVAGGRSLTHPETISCLSNILAYYPDIAVVALRDECSSKDIASAWHLGLQGIIPSHLPKRVAIAALTFVLEGGNYFPYSCMIPMNSAGLAGYKVVEPVRDRCNFGLALSSRSWSEAMGEDEPALRIQG